jgi:hypothetical protein
MLSNRVDPIQRCDGLRRRDVFRLGGLAGVGLGLGAWPRFLSGSTTLAGRARACILVWLDGGPSHLETFDPKPDAPAEVRGPLGTIATAVPGARLSECLPGLARRLDRLAVIRSVTSPLGEHNLGSHYLLTGYPPTPALDYPSLGAVTAHLKGGVGALPAHVAVPDAPAAAGAGYLPAAARPFAVGGDPARPDFQVRDLMPPPGLDGLRAERRRSFLAALEGFRRGAETSGIDPELEQAYRLSASTEGRRAFALEEEPTAVRDRYGRRTIGQACLLARRLVERGVRFVTVTDRGWDTHQDLSLRLKDGYAGAKVGVGLVPSLDQAVSSLIDDLDDRGRLGETLVLVMGEFGRTPKVNTLGGRDHWPRVFSVMLAGGGVPGGLVLGASDRTGESPADRPLTPADLAATIYHLLGIDPTQTLRTADGRPVRVNQGGVAVSELTG